MPTTRRVVAGGGGASNISGGGGVSSNGAVASTTSATTSEATTIVDESPLGMNARQVVKPLSLEVSGGSGGKDAGSGIDSSGNGTADEGLSMDERYENERWDMKVKHWKESPFAVGLTEVSWQDEKSQDKATYSTRHYDDGYDHDDPYGNVPYQPSRDPTGCLCCSAMVCTYLGAGRVGNMIVLKQSMEWSEEIDNDQETGEDVVRRVNRPKLDVVVGPYWPMLVFVTVPLIIGISGWTLWSAILQRSSMFDLVPTNPKFKRLKPSSSDDHEGKHIVVILLWAACTIGLISSLLLTSCRDPGILYKHSRPPKTSKNAAWRWSDHAQTYRPRGAVYDPDTAVVVEEFDHTCPWTGTAIGKKNMCTFQIFVCLVFVCMIFDILLLAGAMD